MQHDKHMARATMGATPSDRSRLVPVRVIDARTDAPLPLWQLLDCHKATCILRRLAARAVSISASFATLPKPQLHHRSSGRRNGPWVTSRSLLLTPIRTATRYDGAHNKPTRHAST